MMRHACWYHYASAEIMRDLGSINFMFDLSANKQKYFFTIWMKVAFRLLSRIDHKTGNGGRFRPCGRRT